MAGENKENGAGGAGGAGVSVATLEKSVEAVTAAAKVLQETGGGRLSGLMAKAGAGGALTDAEKMEVSKALGIGPSLAEGAIAELRPDSNSVVKSVVDVQPYLAELHDGIQAYTLRLGAAIEKSLTQNVESESRFSAFAAGIAKGFSDLAKVAVAQASEIAELRKSLGTLATDFGAFAREPARGPKAQIASIAPVMTGVTGVGAGGAPVEKSFGAQGEDPGKLRAFVLNELELMSKASMEGGQGGYAACGKDITMEISKAEAGLPIDADVYAELLAFNKFRSGARPNGAGAGAANGAGAGAR